LPAADRWLGMGKATHGSRWIAQAFGLELRGRFRAPGLADPRIDAAENDLQASAVADGDAAPARVPVVHVRVVGEQAPTDWCGPESRRLLHWRFDDGRAVMSIDHHPDFGHRLFAIGQGEYVVSGDGSSVSCAPRGAEDWVWQRYLVGQVLPLAAVVNGYEVLHASAVAIHDAGVAFVADSGTGKTSLALNMVLRGARFLTDDVAAISVRDDSVMVHPGPRLTNLRREEDARLGKRRALLGEVIGSDAEGLRIAIHESGQSVPLRAVYFLERGADGARPRFAELRDRHFQCLGRFSFTRYLSTPDRLRNQLDAFGAISDGGRLFRVSIPTSMGAAELGAHVERHVADECA